MRERICPETGEPVAGGDDRNAVFRIVDDFFASLLDRLEDHGGLVDWRMMVRKESLVDGRDFIPEQIKICMGRSTPESDCGQVLCSDGMCLGLI